MYIKQIKGNRKAKSPSGTASKLEKWYKNNIFEDSAAKIRQIS